MGPERPRHPHENLRLEAVPHGFESLERDPFQPPGLPVGAEARRVHLLDARGADEDEPADMRLVGEGVAAGDVAAERVAHDDKVVEPLGLAPLLPEVGETASLGGSSRRAAKPGSPGVPKENLFARLNRVGVEGFPFLARLPRELGARRKPVAEEIDAVHVEAQAGLPRTGRGEGRPRFEAGDADS